MATAKLVPDTLRAWARQVGREAIPLLEQACTHPDPFVRETACDLLGELRSATSLPYLMTALGDRHIGVVESAIYAIAQASPNEARLILAMLSHPIPSVRSSACKALRSLSTAIEDADLRHAIVQALESAALHDTDLLTRMLACDALEDWGSETSLQVLSQLLRRRGEHLLIRALAKSVLASLQSRTG